jgi:hypothetical protein
MRKPSYCLIKQRGGMVIVTNGRDKDGDIVIVTVKKSKANHGVWPKVTQCSYATC